MAPSRKKPKSSLAALSDVQNAPTQPIYLLVGKDSFLRNEYLGVIRSKVFGNGPDDFNHDRFDWAETDVSTIISIAQTLPFMAEKRLVEIHNFARPGERDESTLLAYLDHPSVSTVLVFCVENVDMRTTFFQRLVKASNLCRVDILEGEDLRKWLHGRAMKLGFELRQEAIDMLLEMVKPSMMRLSTELEKIASYLMPGAIAGVEEIREIVGHSKEELLYKLGDSLSQGSLGGTLTLLRRMMETEHPVVFVGLLRNLIRRWTISKALIRSGLGAEGISQVLGLPPFVARRLENQVKGLGSVYLRNLYGKLLQVDRKLKRTSDMKVARQELELFIIEVRSFRSGTHKVA
ncbi:MAG: DNA polymerase III subunit delta [Nitrospinae bacterium]|nr:DNA polymerase III subunit delta [Nitrospinota bacterium]